MVRSCARRCALRLTTSPLGLASLLHPLHQNLMGETMDWGVTSYIKLQENPTFNGKINGKIKYTKLHQVTQVTFSLIQWENLWFSVDFPEKTNPF